ncbi:MAG: ATP-binding protein [Salinivirgaceae bacterium]|nr:ATP-binding protein [Salinivirgaceae bacterium]
MRYRFAFLFIIMILVLRVGADTVEPAAWNGEKPVAIMSWDFYGGVHLLNSLHNADPVPVTAGESWNNYPVGDSVMGAYGIGTYVTTLVLPEGNSSYQLDLGTVSSAFRVYVNNQLIKSVGEANTRNQGYRPQYNTEIISFSISQKITRITIQVANYKYGKGGLWQVPFIAKDSKAEKKRNRVISYLLFLFGGIVILSIYHGILFILRKNEQAPLFFFLWTFAASVRLLFSGRYYPILNLYSLSYDTIVRVEYFTFYVAIPLFIKFMCELFPRFFNKKLVDTYFYVGIGASLVVWLVPISLLAASLIYYQVFTVLGIFYILYIFYSRIAMREVGTMLFLMGFGILVITVFHDILVSHDMFNQTYWFPVGLTSFVFSQAYYLAANFINTFNRADRLGKQLNYMNLHLEKIVGERTDKLKEANKLLKQKNNEISKQSRQLEIMNKELRKLSVVTSETDNAVMIVQPDGTIEWINQGFTRLYGYSLPELQKRFGYNLKRAGQTEKIVSIFNKVKETGQSVNYESEVEAKNGEIITVQTTLSPIYDLNNELLYLVAIDSDIRKLKQIQLELRKSNSAKNKLFSIVAHDLRNPFNSLIGLTDLMVERYANLTSDELLGFIKDLNDVSRKTYYLLLNLLEWSRSQRDKITIKPEEFNLVRMVEEIIDLFDNLLETKDLTCVIDIPNNMILYADKNSINTVLRNLISNAIKFSSPGKSISIHAQQQFASTQIIVSDQGVGMSEVIMSNLFDSENNQSTPGTEQEKGTGLGLMLCKYFVEKNKGSIRVESKPDKGTDFIVSLPNKS